MAKFRLMSATYEYTITTIDLEDWWTPEYVAAVKIFNPNFVASHLLPSENAIPQYNTLTDVCNAKDTIITALTPYLTSLIEAPTIHNCVQPLDALFFDIPFQYAVIKWGNEVVNQHRYIIIFSNYPSIIKRIQRYKFTRQDSFQSLCSLKETGYTKITGFRKWSL